MQPVQVRMARAALGLSLDDLARQTGMSTEALAELERGVGGAPETTQGLSLFFASHGIELVDGDGVRATSGEAANSVTVDRLTTGNDGGEG